MNGGKKHQANVQAQQVAEALGGGGQSPLDKLGQKGGDSGQGTQDVAQRPGPLIEARSGKKTEQGGEANGTGSGTPATPTTPTTPTTTTTTSGSAATSVQEAAERTHVQFKPVLRGDEKQKDAAIRTQGDFGRAADEVAREYGLDPNLFRAQLQSESAAFTQDYRQAMRAEGDLDRKSENNTSIGLGQISRKFLDGREWADGASGNARVGGQVVSTEQYMNSPTIQLRMAASNLAQRIADHGGLQQGLAYYVSGNADPSNSHAAQYLANIDRAMKDPQVTGAGR